MSTPRILILVLAAVTLAGTVIAAETELPPAPEQKFKPRVATVSPVQALRDDVRDAIAAHRDALTALTARLEGAPPEDVMKIQREVARSKSEIQVEILRLQLRYAEMEDKTEAVDRIAAALERMTRPTAPGTPKHSSPDKPRRREEVAR